MLTILGIVLILLIVLLILRVPIFASLAISGVVGIGLLKGFGLAEMSMYVIPYSAVSAYLLSAVPLFILMGAFASYSGASTGAYSACYSWVGRLPGGLAMSTILACGLFAATSGSSLATAGIMGRIALPEMQRRGYDMKLATGSVAAGGLLGIMIPPSIIFVIYASMVEISVGKMLIAGVIPGIVTLLVYMAGISIICKLDPSVGPPAPPLGWRLALKSLGGLWGVALLVVIVAGGIYSGFFTPTEAAAVGALAAFAIMVVNRRLTWKNCKESLVSSALTSSMIFALLVGASLLALFLSMSGFPQLVSRIVISWDVQPNLILALILLMYVPMGMFLDAISMMLITVPIVLPILRVLGIDLIWFGILLCMMLEIGLITPPLGMNVFVVKGVSPAGVTMEDVFRGSLSFLAMLAVTVAILFIFPQLSLILPNSMR